MQPRPWYKLHWTTVAGAMLKLLVLAAANFFRHFDEGRMRYGWPTNAATLDDRSIVIRRFFFVTGSQPVPPPQATLEWHYWNLSIDAAAGLLIFLAVIFVLERWRRRPVRPWQFNIRFFLLSITVAAVLYSLHGNFDDLYFYLWHRLSFLPEYNSYDWFTALPWYVVAPLVFGECCLVYAAGWVGFRAASAVIHWGRKFSRPKLRPAPKSP